MLDLAAVIEGPAHTVTKNNKMAQKVYFLSLIWCGVVMQDGKGYFSSLPLLYPVTVRCHCVMISGFTLSCVVIDYFYLH